MRGNYFLLWDGFFRVLKLTHLPANVILKYTSVTMIDEHKSSPRLQSKGVRGKIAKQLEREAKGAEGKSRSSENAKPREKRHIEAARTRSG